VGFRRTQPSSLPPRFVLALPDHYQDRNSWKRATELLMEAAERGAATEQFELALFLEGRYVGQ
jgi:hypothetical protein